MLVQTQEHIKVKTPALLCDLRFVQLVGIHRERDREREREREREGQTVKWHIHTLYIL